MTEIDNDKLLRDFFAENKQEIADNGFSRVSCTTYPIVVIACSYLERFRDDCGGRTFCMVRWIGSNLGNHKRSIYRYD